MTTEDVDAGQERRRRRLFAAVVAVVLALLLIALIPWLIAGPKSTPKAEPTTGTPTGYRLLVSSLHIDAPMRGIQTTRGGVLDPPANPREVGYWTASAPPGASYGQTVVTGHTVHTGGGQMDHLATVKVGSQVEIVDQGFTVYYTVTKVFKLSKRDVDLRSPELFGQSSPTNRLVLITCGDWTGHGYLTNVFVWATPTRTVLAPATS
ncbi:hypothetical protein Back2_14240 [Nocardioides baekrokdamisoli]|uniref:Class F sortase n=1 Tax=Nocardioides baekrokdamisoli TaxID=1804624 RepID=A0A3G9IDV3_9ACTN|nr:class F sortase [Nocardioides baekrokdamisoli]BBH17137.1 hypothetical protein Back2_14240 [Nocardioides baekrokdamisoli]